MHKSLVVALLFQFYPKAKNYNFFPQTNFCSIGQVGIPISSNSNSKSLGFLPEGAVEDFNPL